MLSAYVSQAKKLNYSNTIFGVFITMSVVVGITLHALFIIFMRVWLILVGCLIFTWSKTFYMSSIVCIRLNVFCRVVGLGNIY